MSYPPKIQKNIIELSLILEDFAKKFSKQNCAIAFSGGLDSTTLAIIFKKYFKPKLLTVSYSEKSEDLNYSKNISKKIKLKLYPIIIKRKEILQVYPQLWKLKKGTLVDLEIMSACYFLAKKAKELNCKYLIFGSGAEELFVGYNKYFVALKEGKNLKKILNMELKTLPKRDILRIKKVCQLFKIKPIFPFLNKKFINTAKKIPLSFHINQDLSKPILREIAKNFSVPYEVVYRKKRALQYGSGIHKIFLKLIKNNKIFALPPRPPFVYD
jgi:asparagine synthase (glutamine-hydrolysing)